MPAACPRPNLRTFACLTTLALALAAPLVGQAPVQGIEALTVRNIGPAGMSGRVSAVDVVLSDPSIIFVGSATGGVFRSRDGGVSWEPIFDDQPALGIGAVAVFQPDPSIVWVGGGEGNPRNSAGVGDGIFRSRDGGDSWERVGLEGSERIHRVITHPTDPDIVWAGVMGPAWSDGEIRGVYKTVDGGDSWERVLYVDESTGVGDLVIDPSNPDRLFAAMWDYRRYPDFFHSGGPGSGLHLTEDGGATWSRLGPDEGLPEGELGRMGLAISPSDPWIVYALVEATRSELLRSDDGGRTFTTVSDRPGIAPRPFYYADLRVDPADPDRIYSLHSSAQVSTDGGETFRTMVSSSILHGDVHELWIDPTDGRHMIMGNDGGIGISWDGGDNWRFVENLTLAQFYHISLDDRVPFNVYGGLQDNGSWFGPTDVWENKGILNAHWTRVGGGDGFSVFDDASSDRWGYSMSQGGNLQTFDRLTGQRRGIRPAHPDGVDLRFNWNAALSTDPLDPSALYLGSQFVHRTRDRGASWEIISPDLTTDDPAKQRWGESGGLTTDATGAETHTTLIDISPSPLVDGVIWAGSDDGNVQVTRDDGDTWTNTVPAMTGAPETGWVADIEPSHHEPGRAWVVFDEHRRGDWTPYLFRTDDFGATWRRMGDDIPAFLLAVEEDPHEPNLVFVGTEFGLYMTLNGGTDWQRVPTIPAVPIRDLELHERDGDLVLGTHGRGVWVIDGVHALRGLAARPELADEPVHLFETGPTWLHNTAEAIGYRSTGMAMWQGATRDYGALLTIHRGAPSAEATIRVEDGMGLQVAEWTAALEPGLNRVVWDLEANDPAEGTDLADGMEVWPGRYTVTVDVEGARSSGTVEVHPDPRVPAPDRMAGRERVQALREASAQSDLALEAMRRVRLLQQSVSQVMDELSGDRADRAEALLAAIEGYQEQSAGDAAALRAPASRLRSGTGPVEPHERMLMERAATAVEALRSATDALLTGPATDFAAAMGDDLPDGFPELTPLGAGGMTP
ncbi:WD40/YVTN/BNR-like repeat-containing protein [Gaopeijia maritima]|uniref:Sortilin N-terminal domain-containing protein n=1 Tax=Gaopeijia maritima TaxID=3119007 RepID=A0ABU9E6K9_9BACT